MKAVKSAINSIKGSDNGNKLEASQIPEFYTNSVMINVSPYEVEIQNQLIDSGSNLKGAVNLRMSPQTAWTLWKALGKQIEAYEAGYGEIPIAEEVRKGLQ